MRQFQVIGEDEDYPYVEGVDVMGDDDDDGEEVVGYDDEGYPIVVGAARRPRRRRRKPRLVLSKPGWRNSQLAPGVIAPDQGLLPLPMGSVTFSTSVPTFTFTGQLQKPFRGERLLVTTVRTGTTAVARVLGQMFVGSDLAQLDVPAIDIEQVGGPSNFGVRLTMKPAQPGVQIRIATSLSSALAGTDTIFCTITLLGRLIH